MSTCGQDCDSFPPSGAVIFTPRNDFHGIALSVKRPLHHGVMVYTQTHVGHTCTRIRVYNEQVGIEMMTHRMLEWKRRLFWRNLVITIVIMMADVSKDYKMMYLKRLLQR